MKLVKDLKGYEEVRDIYYIDRGGDTWSYGNYGSINRATTARKLTNARKVTGYEYIALMTDDGGRRDIRVHRLVADAYIPNPENKETVNHIDEVKHNNRVNNLEWATYSENNIHSKGKITFMYDSEGNLEKVYEYMGAAVKDGFNRGHVASCARGEVRSHKGKLFSYVKLNKEEAVQRLSKPTFHASRE